MNEKIKYLLNNLAISTFDFPVYYRERGRKINKKIDNDIPMLPEEIKQEEYKGSINGSDIRDLLLEENGHSILWLLNASDAEGKSALDVTSRLFRMVNKVTRGGINVYKQNGWMVHVLYVYELIAHNFAQNIIPTSFAAEHTEVIEKVHILSKIYNDLKPENKYLIRLLALIHDIGVIDGVQNHDKDGEKYVLEILDDLDITDGYFNNIGVNLDFNYVIGMLKVFVANHTLINKISSEDGDECIKEKVDAIKKQLTFREALQVDFSDYAKIFLLLGMADLIAVDDSLFTVRKFNLAYSSYQYLDALFNGNSINRDKKEVALLRLYEMIPEDVYTDLGFETKQILIQEGLDEVEKFWICLYDVYKFEYSTAYFKTLKSLPCVVKSLIEIFLTIDSRGDKLKQCIIRFCSTINSSMFVQAVLDGDFIYCTQRLRIVNGVEGKFLKMSVIKENGKTVYIIEQK